MIFTPNIRSAIRFAIKTHEIDQKQKRKGKDIAYLGHPLTVGLVLARAGADEDTIVAGILHDTIEDSVAEKKVTREMIAKQFGENVAMLVDSVTEDQKAPSWEDRKREALEHIETFSHGSVLLKSADILSNGSEIVDDYEVEGAVVFGRFHASRKTMLEHYIRTISALLKRWPDSPLAVDLKSLAGELGAILE